MEMVESRKWFHYYKNQNLLIYCYFFMKKTQTISLPIEEEIAKEISRSSEVDREDIALLLSLWLQKRRKERVEDFFRKVDAISFSAREKGLSEEKLKEILAD